jgi:pyruvate decarboxylase
MCKGIIDETHSNYAGVYAGNGSYDFVRDFVDKSDLVLSIGAVRSDFSTTGTPHSIILLSSYVEKYSRNF